MYSRVFCLSIKWLFIYKYFSHYIIIDKERNKGNQNRNYKLKKWKKCGTYDIFNYINENVTSVQLMDNVVNVNHAVIISGFWVYN